MYDKNYVKIKCNPYIKRIEYYYLNESGEWVPVSSKLAADAFTKVTIQHKVHEIIQEINKVYNLGNKGLELIFEGTEDDYRDVCTELSEYFADYKINCVRGDLRLDSADSVMPAITNIFSDIEVTFQEYPDDEITAVLAKFSETIKPIISICVMGLYSSGKSAFINSLIGDEILPSASDPTTAKNYRISTGDKAKIQFKYDEKEIELSFSGEKYSANQPGELEIIRELQSAVDTSEVHSQSTHMYRALQVINGFDDNHNDGKHVSTLIEVCVPFVNSRLPLEEFDFAIYDTPGSDSNHKDHLEVLKDSLQGQTNGLPIFVTTPDEMDKEKNNEIIEIIERMGETLDQTSTMVIVNKSDEKDSGVLEDKKKKGNELRITKWRSLRVFFVSSVMGLGSKKEKPLEKKSWRDKQYFKVFKQQYDSFSDPEDDFYMQLYKYNFLPQNRADQVLSEAGKVTSGEQLILLNSGIGSVEEEIAIFAHKYALYNKCVQARQYLEKAIDLVSQKSAAAEAERKRIGEKIKLDIDKKTRELIDKLTQESDKLAADINTGYSDGIQEKIEEAFDEETEQKLIEESWESIKKREKKAEKRNEQIEDKVNEQYNIAHRRICNSVNSWSGTYWSDAEQKYKKRCCEIITESAFLTKEQKKFLNEYVMGAASIEVENIKMDLRRAKIIRDKKFLFFKIGEKFHLSSCKEKFVSSLNRAAMLMNSRAVSENEGKFKQWRNGMEAGFESKISAFNPALAQLTDDMEKCRREIERINKQRNVLGRQKELLEGLLDFKEVEG